MSVPRSSLPSPVRSPDQLASAVAAWHNLHPLARRIAPDQVHGLGVIELPLARAAPPSRAAAQLLCDTAALYRTPPRRLAAWLHRHGHASPALPDHLPRRRFEEDPLLAAQAARDGQPDRQLAVVLTAAVDVDGKRLRLLLSLGPRPRIFGSRAWSLARIGVGATAAMLLAALSGAWLAPGTPVQAPPLLASVSRPDPPAAASAVSAVAAPAVSAVAAPAASAVAAPAASAVAARGASAPEPFAPEASVLAAAPTPNPRRAEPSAEARSSKAAMPVAIVAAVTAKEAPPARPVADGGPTSAAPPATNSALRPRVVPTLDPEVRARALAQGRALRASKSPTLIALASGRAFAIVTRPAPNRTQALAQLALMRGVVAQVRTELPTQVDLMQSGRQWRVAWWPHPSREVAARHLAEASARGLKLELVVF